MHVNREWVMSGCVGHMIGAVNREWHVWVVNMWVMSGTCVGHEWHMCGS